MSRKYTMREIRSLCLADRKRLKTLRPVGTGVFVCAVLADRGCYVREDAPYSVRFTHAAMKVGTATGPKGEVTFRRKELAVLYKSDEIAEPEVDLSELEPTIITPVRTAPLAVTVKGACEMCSLGRATLYRAIDAGLLIARKYDSRTLILVEELDAFLKNLPTSK